METYSVDLTKEQIERLANETDGFWGMEDIADVLRNAQPAQPDALQRLEEWIMEGYEDEQDDYRDADISVDNGGICRCALTWWSVKEHGHHFMESHHIGESNTLADAINAALDAAEGAEDA